MKSRQRTILLVVLSLIATLQFGCTMSFTTEFGKGPGKPARTFQAGFDPSPKQIKVINQIF